MCPLFNEAREKLRIVCPSINQPRRSLACLVKRKTIEHTLEFLASRAFSQFHTPYKPP